jgi:hypothetical protein
VQLYRAEREQSWVELRTNAEANNVFERGAPVELRFAVRGEPDDNATGIRYQVRDYWDEEAAAGALSLDGRTEFAVPFPSDVPGFFEVRASWTRRDGTPDERSCLRETGSMPFGMSTFAVMPRTVEENTRGMTQDSFFGLHGATQGMNELIGAAWTIPHYRWNWVEAERADRSGGAAPWVAERTAEGPAPPYLFAVFNFTQHLGDIPGWARADTTQFPAWKDWADWLAFVRDSVRVHVLRYPHMKPRVYDLAWEPDLQMGYGNQVPTMTPQDMVELYARTVPVIRAEDPDALIMGPCPSGEVKDATWYRELFEAGLIKYLDAISLHPYHSPPPETADLPGKLQAIREVVREYAGRDLPIYATEYGYRTARGSDCLYREHAQWLARANCILKGEGVRIALPFFGYDYPGDGSFGICFNLDPKLNWGPKRIAPKPAVPALAAQVAALNRARPVGRMDVFGPGICAYAFEKGRATVIAIWSPEGDRVLPLPNVRAEDVVLMDIMGRERRPEPGRGPVEIRVGPDILYVIHSPGQTARP